MKIFLLHILLTVVWAALTGHYTLTNFGVGLLLSLLVIWLLDHEREAVRYLERIRSVPGFIAFFLWELVKANLRVAHDLFTPRYRMHPAILAIPLDLDSDLEITVLASLITLTPGTLSLDVSADRRTLFVHAMYVGDPDAFREHLKKGLEARVRKVLR